MKTKIISMTLCLLMLITLLVGCQTPSEEAELKKVTNVYKSNIINLPEKCSVNSMTLAMNSDDRMYVLGNEVIDEENWTTKSFIYSFDLNGENVELEYIELAELVNNDNFSTYVNNYFIASNGYEIYYLNAYDMETNKSTRIFNIYDTDGNLIFSVDPKTYFNTEVDTSRYYGMDADYDYFYVNRMCISGDDVIYMATENAVAAVNIDGAKLFEISIESNFIENLIASDDGKVMIMYYDSNTYDTVFCAIDPQTKALGDPIKLPVSRNNVRSIYAGPGYDTYYTDNNNIYGYNIGGEPVTLMNMINSDINPNSISELYIIDENKFVYIGYDYLSGGQQFSILTRIPDDEVVPKKIINMAFLYADTYMLVNHVIHFNRTNDEYRIIMTDYSLHNTEDDYEIGQTKFTQDILSANIPDIMILNSSMPLNDYINKGVFADLYELMDSKSGLKKDNILQCVRNSYETNGKLYNLPSSIEMQTLVGLESIVGDKEGWTFDEVIELMEKYPDSYLTPYVNKFSMFDMLMIVGIDDYIDYETATCRFDSEEFINLMKYIGDFDEKSYTENLSEDAQMEFWGNDQEYYNNGTFLLRQAYFYSFSDLLSLKVSYNNEPITFKGFPSASHNGGYISSYSLYTVSERSEYKDGIWDFLNYVFSDDVMTSERMNRGDFPATVSGFNISAENAKKTHYYMDPNGRGYSASDQPMEEGSYNTDEIHMQVTDEDIAFIKRYMNDISMKVDYNNKVLEIISEDIQMFLAGEKSAEETAKVIQSRAQLYLSENS